MGLCVIQCLFYLQDMSRTQCENVFTQASFSEPVWEQAIKLIDLFENGKLHNQRLQKKNLLSKPEFKPHHFQCLHNLNPAFQKSMLEQVINKTLTLSAMKKKAIEHRALQNIRNAFMKVTRISSWQEAQEKYPRHATEQKLSQFLGLNFVNNVPETFKTFCKFATTSRGANSAMHMYQDAEATVIEMDFSRLEETAIKAVYQQYSGAGLIMITIPMVSTHFTMDVYVCVSVSVCMHMHMHVCVHVNACVCARKCMCE